MIKIIGGVLISLLVLFGTANAQMPGYADSVAATQCAMNEMKKDISGRNFVELSADVSVACEAEIVLSAESMGATMPEDYMEYQKAVFEVASGMVGELLRIGYIQCVVAKRRIES